jgi:hypothetical protein
MLFCKDCRQRAMLESTISKQKICEDANDFYERLIIQWHIKERFLFGLTPNNLEKILKTDIEMPLHSMIKLLTNDKEANNDSS